MKTHTIVVGGTRGIGRAVAKNFAGEGHAVSVIGKREPAEKDREIKNVDYWIADLSYQDSTTKALSGIISKNGKITNLVFCQRYRGDKDFWNSEFQVSLTATKSIIEQLAEKFEGEGSIVAITSAASAFIAEEQPLSYHVAKAGVRQLVRYYAVMLGPKGIRVNSVSPITILKDESKQFYTQNESIMNMYREIVPLGRMGTAEEIADVVAFLCSKKSSFITGQEIVVDGGVSLQSHEAMARRLDPANSGREKQK